MAVAAADDRGVPAAVANSGEEPVAVEPAGNGILAATAGDDMALVTVGWC